MLKINKLIIGVFLSVILTVGLLAVISFFIVRMGALPGSIAGTLSMAAGAVGMLTSAIITARLAGERGLIHGTVLAGIYSILFAILSILLCEAISSPLLIIRIIIYILCGALGGVIGVSHKSKIQF